MQQKLVLLYWSQGQQECQEAEDGKGVVTLAAMRSAPVKR